MTSMKTMLAIVFVFIECMTLAIADERGEESMNNILLSLEIETTKISRLESSLMLIIKLENISDEDDFQLISVASKPPYSIMVWGQSGKNLNSIANTPVIKDRTHKEVVTLLAKNATMEFRVDFNLKNIVLKNKNSAAASEHFDIQVSYPLIWFADGTYKTKIIHSKRIEVMVVY